MKERVNFFWCGDNLGDMEKACLHSFVFHNFEVNLWSFNKEFEVEGCNSRDADEIIPGLRVDTLVNNQRSLDSTPQGVLHAKLAVISDIFRYNVLNKVGGWYCDVDVFCLRDQAEWMRLKAGKPFVIANQRPQNKHGAGSAVLNFSEPFATSFISEFNQFVEKHKGTTSSWGAYGPGYLSRYIGSLSMAKHFVSCNSFYPIDYDDYALIYTQKYYDMARNRLQHESSYGIHLWKGVRCKLKIDKNDFPPTNTLIHYLMNLYK